uniref:ATP synthase F0 subunit 8 n=1 Tax=Ophidion muraenolepis TaxID=2589338 RepID=UPI0028FCACD1|nr:ATP synthase F0 subunit 8 [Ophidion muraenolepis]WNH38085.1 ATP synthase F0 subunit 8 [Ophidion muraenolepis]
MPQLNPHPWFLIMLCTWVVLLVIIPPKVLAHTYPGEPTTKSTKALKSQPLHMPWS